jgi:hypothetical protein
MLSVRPCTKPKVSFSDYAADNKGAAIVIGILSVVGFLALLFFLLTFAFGAIALVTLKDNPDFKLAMAKASLENSNPSLSECYFQ